MNNEIFENLEKLTDKNMLILMVVQRSDVKEICCLFSITLDVFKWCFPFQIIRKIQSVFKVITFIPMKTKTSFWKSKFAFFFLYIIVKVRSKSLFWGGTKSSIVLSPRDSRWKQGCWVYNLELMEERHSKEVVKD